MSIIKIILICLIIYSAAYILGRGLFPALKDKGTGLSLAGGLMVIFASFYAVTLPAVFLQDDENGMNVVMWVYSVLISICLIVSIALTIMRIARKKEKIVVAKPMLDTKETIYLALFIGIVLFQLFKAAFYAYADGDDAYYIAVAQSLGSGQNSLYMHDPYTGEMRGLMTRYALAPFSAWVAYFARLFSVNAATVAHIGMPLSLIPITYVIYNAVGEKLFPDNRTKKYMFLCLIAVFVMFSHYSYNSAEVFLLTRARQGKEALANIIVPMLFFEILDISGEEEWKITNENLIMIILICISAALTSVFGNVLVLIMLFFNLVYSFVRKAGWKERIKAAVPAVVNLFVLFLYAIK